MLLLISWRRAQIPCVVDTCIYVVCSAPWVLGPPRTFLVVRAMRTRALLSTRSRCATSWLSFKSSQMRVCMGCASCKLYTMSGYARHVHVHVRSKVTRFHDLRALCQALSDEAFGLARRALKPPASPAVCGDPAHMAELTGRRSCSMRWEGRLDLCPRHLHRSGGGVFCDSSAGTVLPSDQSDYCRGHAGDRRNGGSRRRQRNPDSLFMWLCGRWLRWANRCERTCFSPTEKARPNRAGCYTVVRTPLAALSCATPRS